MQVKKLLFLTLFISSSAFGQGVRVGDERPLQTSAVIQGVTVIVPAGASSVQFCNAPANAVPCTNKATTYTDQTLGTPCSTSTQVVLAGTSSCVAQSDSLGNWGVWVSISGTTQYQWTYTDPQGNSHGPYPVTVGIPPTTSFNNLSNSLGNLNIDNGAFTSDITAYTSPAVFGGFVGEFAHFTLGIASPIGGGVPNIFAVGVNGGAQGFEVIDNQADEPGEALVSLGSISALAWINNGDTTTVRNKLAKFTGGGVGAVLIGTSETAGKLIGICLRKCGVLGLQYIATSGVAKCVFDNATTASDWVTVSTTIAGDCHDAGASVPATTLSTVGRVLSTNGSAGTYLVLLQISR